MSFNNIKTKYVCTYKDNRHYKVLCYQSHQEFQAVRRGRSFSWCGFAYTGVLKGQINRLKLSAPLLKQWWIKRKWSCIWNALTCCLRASKDSNSNLASFIWISLGLSGITNAMINFTASSKCCGKKGKRKMLFYRVWSMEKTE